MKKRILMVVSFSLLPLFAAAQPSGSEKGGKGGEPSAAQFQEMKQKLVARIDNRIQVLQQAKTCVQQAQNREQLHECRPERGEKGGRD